jgi:hypothetical protein
LKQQSGAGQLTERLAPPQQDATNQQCWHLQRQIDGPHLARLRFNQATAGQHCADGASRILG